MQIQTSLYVYSKYNSGNLKSDIQWFKYAQENMQVNPQIFTLDHNKIWYSTK